MCKQRNNVAPNQNLSGWAFSGVSLKLITWAVQETETCLFIAAAVPLQQAEILASRSPDLKQRESLGVHVPEEEMIHSHRTV